MEMEQIVFLFLALGGWALVTIAAIVHRLTWFALKPGPIPALVGMALASSPLWMALLAIAILAD